jgi:hypothetical protein
LDYQYAASMIDVYKIAAIISTLAFFNDSKKDKCNYLPIY